MYQRIAQDCPGTGVMVAAERIARQPPRARCTERLYKTNDLAREAVGCTRCWAGGPDLPLTARLAETSPTQRELLTADEPYRNARPQ
jgi:hypothetical protein